MTASVHFPEGSKVLQTQIILRIGATFITRAVVPAPCRFAKNTDASETPTTSLGHGGAVVLFPCLCWSSILENNDICTKASKGVKCQ